ncbi:hypothetical protein AB0L82_01320 [Nocardia sp. NPDC052001]|uniref:hypothetical protein n=1 Tax=Nocardia sp. NPDC052001 TaxID=3154853 RepID=UPI0034416D12
MDPIPTTPPHVAATWTAPPTPTTAVDTGALDKYGPQLTSWAKEAVKYGNEAGVDPDLVLAMALQEGAPLRLGLEGSAGEKSNLYTALDDPSTFKSRINPNGAEAGVLWDQARYNASQVGADKSTWEKLKHGHILTMFQDDPGNSLGLTNMKKDQFNEVRNRYPQLQGYEYKDLIGNDDLAMKMTAYNLKMLYDGAASQAPQQLRTTPLDQFLGSGYNAGGTLGRSQGVATGGSNFLPNEVEHGQSTVNVVRYADQILYGSGAYK